MEKDNSCVVFWCHKWIELHRNELTKWYIWLKIQQTRKNWILSISFIYVFKLYFIHPKYVNVRQVPFTVKNREQEEERLRLLMLQWFLHQGAVTLKMTNTCNRSRKWGWSDRGPHVDYSTYMFHVQKRLWYPTFMFMEEFLKQGYSWKTYNYISSAWLSLPNPFESWLKKK